MREQATGEQKMARPKINIDKLLLVKAIETCENEKNYTKRSDLFHEAAQIYNNECGNLPKINGQLIYLRIPEFGITLKTPKGKRGRAAGCLPTNINRGERVPRAEKFASNPQTKVALAAIRHEIKISAKSQRINPAAALNLVDKLENGSISAAIKLKCLDCTNFQKDEIRNCECTSCPLYIIRPYQKDKQEEGDE